MKSWRKQYLYCNIGKENMNNHKGGSIKLYIKIPSSTPDSTSDPLNTLCSFSLIGDFNLYFNELSKQGEKEIVITMCNKDLLKIINKIKSLD